MKFKFSMMLLVAVLLLVNTAWSIDQTTTGFYYPTGTSDLGPYAGWLASGCDENEDYFEGLYHLGHDFEADLEDPVYAVSDGKVVSISYNGWGTGNVGVFVKHRLSNGNYFLALYGHITTDVTVGDYVYAGKVLGEIGPWSSGNHLHFGIVSGSNIPPTPWGRMDCDDWPATNSFVDPINWITNQTPYPNIGFYSDGWHTNGTSQAFVDAFEVSESGGHDLGYPNDNGGTAYVHQWDNIWVQDFFGTNTQFYHGYTALILNSAGTSVYLLKEGFWDWYMNNDGSHNLGSAESNEYTYGNSIRQDFAEGWLEWDGNEVIAHNTVGAALVSYEATINTDPQGAEIWNNGQLIGMSPLTEDMYEDFTYTMTAEKAGYDDADFEFTIGQNDTTLNIEMTGGGSGGETTGEFKFTSNRNGAIVEVISVQSQSEVFEGYTPTEYVVLDTGSYTIYFTVYDPDDQDTQNLTVNGGEHTTIYCELEENEPPVAQSFQVETIYPNPITVDMTAHVTDAQGSGTINWSTLQIISVSSGTTLVDVSDIDFEPAYRTSGVSNITYKVADDYGAWSNVATLSVNTVEGVYAHSAAFASNSIEIGYDSEIFSGDVMVIDSSAGPTLDSGYELSFGNRCETASGYDIKADDINIDYSSTIDSDIYYNTLDVGTRVDINGTEYTPLSLPVSPVMPILRTATIGTQDTAVASHSSLSLDPGNYKDVTVGGSATLTLTGGEYHFNNFEVSDHANVFFEDISEVYIKERMDIGGGVSVGPAASSSIVSHDIMFYVEGINGTTSGLSESPKAVYLGAYLDFDANIYAQNGTVYIYGSSSYITGAVIAKDVDTGSRTYFTLDSYFSTDTYLSKRTAEPEPAIEAVNNVPCTFSLLQNYPNPFNPETNISYSLPEDCKVTLKIYNSLGQEVVTLVNKQHQAGNYTTIWKAANIPSGIYFYKITASEFSSIKKMILLK